MNFREGARHHGVHGRINQCCTGFVVVAFHILGIGGIDDQQNVITQASAQAL